jgi:hypothetical protein
VGVLGLFNLAVITALFGGVLYVVLKVALPELCGVEFAELWRTWRCQ